MTRFDPERGQLLVAPPSDGKGSWAGAPGALRSGGELFVAYRLRRPLPVRGFELRIGAVRSGRVEDVWRVTKDALASESIERAALVDAGGRYRLYLGHVDARDRKWRVSVMEAPSVDAFDPRHARTVLHPDALEIAAVKDPWIKRTPDEWLMFVSCGSPSAAAHLHSGGDALSTGIVRSETGLASSTDGAEWKWEGIVFATSPRGWDRGTTRLTAAVRDGARWLGYYDGAASLAENYEERCGLARSADLRTWERVSRDGPAVGSSAGAGGVRYVDATEEGDVFWEHTRADGAHELRGIVAGAGR